jgi:ankyrin repeat/BTB/POZ domain-containing protein 1
VILVSISEYFKVRLSRTTGFLERKEGLQSGSLPLLEEHDLSAEAFEKLLEYGHTDKVMDINLDQAEEMFDVASKYLLFSLKHTVADTLLPQLKTTSLEELCHWLTLADMYGVWKIREYCLDVMALSFQSFVDTYEFL